MFPFDSRWRWWFSTGYLHLAEAAEANLQAFTPAHRRILTDRSGKMRVALRVRGVFLFLLNIGLLTSGLAWLGTVVMGLAEVRSLVEQVAQISTALSVLLTVTVLLVSRYLGQLQADLVAVLALGGLEREATLEDPELEGDGAGAGDDG